MLVNPNCPKCKHNRRVISSLKRAVFNPGSCKKATIFSLKKVAEFFAWALNKSMAALQILHKPKFIFKCNNCQQNFKGTQKQSK